MHKSIISLLFSILKDDLIRPFRFRKIKTEFAITFNIPHTQLQRLIIISHRKVLLHRRILILNQVHQLFHYWHVFHKPFAIIMYTIMVVHIGIAVWLGYTWIF